MMKFLNKIIFLVIIGVCTIFTAQAQGSYHRSNISISAGLTVGLNANINYEYRITESSEMSSYIALGAGTIASYSTIPHIDLSHVFLRGSNNNKFEFGYGLTLFDPIDHSALFVNFRLGYRKLSQYNNSFFRTGLSLVEGLYLGLGFNL